MKTTIFFDYDGVIVDSVISTAKTQTEIARRFGRSGISTPELIRAQWGNGWQNFYKNVLGFSEAEEILQTIPHYQELAATVGFAPEAFPEIKNVIEELTRTHALHIVSGNYSDVILKNLTRLGLDHHFENIFGCDKIGSMSKHDPEFYLIPARLLGLHPEEIILLGDTTDEVVGGRAAGIAVIACAWGWLTEERLATASPDYIAQNPRHLQLLINEISGDIKETS